MADSDSRSGGLGNTSRSTDVINVSETGDAPASTIIKSSGHGGPESGTGEASSGSGAGGGDVQGPRNLDEFKAYRWNGDEGAFLRDVEWLVNNDPNFYREFYTQNVGHRRSASLKIGLEEWPLPQLAKDNNTGDWVPLRSPEQPIPLIDKIQVRVYHPDFVPRLDESLSASEYKRRKELFDALGSTDEDRFSELERREHLRNQMRGLESMAGERRRKNDEALAADVVLRAEEKAHHKFREKGPNHPHVESAKRDYQEKQTKSTEICEDLGEEAAAIAARHEFDGSVLRDADGRPVTRPVLDENGDPVMENGEPVLEEVRKPDLRDAVLIGKADKAPLNGNDQFDLIFKTPNGEYVVIEAKGSTRTDLGDRTVQPVGQKPRKVSQGTLAYFKDILEAMRSREGSKISNGGSGNPSGVVSIPKDEVELAQELQDALNEKKVTYAVFKGNPVRGNSRNGAPGGVEVVDGYDFQIFDLEG